MTKTPELENTYFEFVRELSLLIANTKLSVYLDVGEMNAEGKATIIIEVEPDEQLVRGEYF